MDRISRSRLAGGILLILLGGLFLVARLVPGFEEMLRLDVSWPLIVIGVGAALLFLGLILGEPDLAVPACVVGGVGGILYWQNATGNWASWGYVWTLIPGFVGVGIILSSLLKGNRRELGHGANMIMTSIVLFVVFAALLGGLNVLGPYWPVLLIVVGVVLLVRAFVR